MARQGVSCRMFSGKNVTQEKRVGSGHGAKEARTSAGGMTLVLLTSETGRSVGESEYKRASETIRKRYYRLRRTSKTKVSIEGSVPGVLVASNS
jgi:hypothetical protein